MAFAATVIVAACGSPRSGSSNPVAAPSTASATAAPADTTGKTAPANADAKPAADAKPTAEPPAKATGNELTEEKLRASKALDAPFPHIDEVTKEIGAPFAQGKAKRRAWWFDKRPLGKTFSCNTIDLIQGPEGRVVLDVSVNTSDECKKVPVTKAQVVELLAKLAGESVPPDDPIPQFMARNVQGKMFDETAALFEKKFGKPRETGEPDFAAWRYANEDGECRVVLVTSYLGSNAGQAIWDLPCK
jgi:hypothetical protein